MYCRLDDEAIRYATRPADDPVERLNRKIAQGEVKLEFDDAHGYLRGVLKALDIPVESQVLVFSKTSFQAAAISPERPRALYFNDSTAVGSVHSSDLLEFASVDPKLGVIFYTLDQKKVDKPHFDRRDAAVPAVPRLGGADLGRARLDGALGLSGSFRHAGIPGGRILHRPAESAQGALGRLVCHRHARRNDAHGQRSGSGSR